MGATGVGMVVSTAAWIKCCVELALSSGLQVILFFVKGDAVGT